MYPAIGGIAQPDFLLVGSQCNAVTGTTVQLNRDLLEAGHSDALNLLPGSQVADFETQKRIGEI